MPGYAMGWVWRTSDVTWPLGSSMQQMVGYRRALAGEGDDESWRGVA